MNDITIAIVVSPFGLGHLTRQIALIQTINQRFPEIKIRLICSDKHYEMFHSTFQKLPTLTHYTLPLTPFVAMESFTQIDGASTIDTFQRFWDFETQVRDDTEWGRILFGTHILINDIEAVHNPIAKKMGLYIINISNFTWSDILDHLDAIQLANGFASWEKLADINYQLPMTTRCLGFNENTIRVGLLVRAVDYQQVKQIKMSSDKPKILFLLPFEQNQNYRNLLESILALDYHIFIRNTDLSIKSTKLKGLPNFTMLSKNETNFQNYIAASNLVIAKLGYGIVSEILSTGTSIAYLIRKGYGEDIALEQMIIDNNCGTSLDTLMTSLRDKSTLQKVMQTFFVRHDMVLPENENIAKLIIQNYQNHLKHQ